MVFLSRVGYLFLSLCLVVVSLAFCPIIGPDFPNYISPAKLSSLAVLAPC